MFVSLNIKEYKDLRFQEKIRHRLGLLKPEPQRVYFENLAYYKINLVGSGEEINFEKIYEISPRFSKSVLMPEGFEPPEKGHVRRHRAARLAEKAGLMSVMALTESARIPLSRRCMGLIDIDGAHQDFAEAMVRFSPVVKVVTKRPDLYDKCADGMMSKYGAPLLLYDGAEFLADCDLIYSPDSTGLSGATKAPIISACRGGRGLPANVYCVKALEVPEKYLAQIPEGIDALDFLDAVYTFGEMNELEKLKVKDFDSAFGTVGFEDILSKIKRYY
ncbi:MAG: hypothetical protein LBC56_03550 [Oscillospiraceae bacterium]|nr:hypothetical protein [Oscillospiraceae bacterium]